MSTFTLMDDHKDAEGEFDFESYEKARKDNGEACTRCNGIVYPPEGSPSVCSGCVEMEESQDQVDNDRLIRCPHCGKTSDVSEDERYDLYGEDWHNATCYECDKDFAVQTHITYTFTSPAMVKEEPK